MLRFIFAALLAVSLMPAATAATPPDSLAKYLATLPADLRVSVVVMDKDSTVLFEQDANHVVAAASVIKVPILVEFLYQVMAGRYKLTDTYFIKESDKVGGSGDFQYEPPQVVTLEKLAVEMIRISDNTATNILIDKMGMENVNGMLAYHGYESTRLNRKMMDFAAVLAGNENRTTAAESARLMYSLLTDKILDEKMCKKALEILLTCEETSTIPRYIPYTVPIAHKSGTLDYVRADSGIIFSDNPLIISVFTENFESLEYAEKVIGTISKIAFDTWGN